MIFQNHPDFAGANTLIHLFGVFRRINKKNFQNIV